MPVWLSRATVDERLTAKVLFIVECGHGGRFSEVSTSAGRFDGIMMPVGITVSTVTVESKKGEASLLLITAAEEVELK